MAYLEHGLHCKPLACAFAVFCVLASFGMGNMAQVNSIAGALNASCGISPLVTGLVVTALAGLILLGGLQRIGTVTQWLIPPLSLLYLLGASAFCHAAGCIGGRVW